MSDYSIKKKDFIYIKLVDLIANNFIENLVYQQHSNFLELKNADVHSKNHNLTNFYTSFECNKKHYIDQQLIFKTIMACIDEFEKLNLCQIIAEKAIIVEKKFDELSLSYKLHSRKSFKTSKRVVFTPPADVTEKFNSGFGSSFALPMIVKPEKWDLLKLTGGFLLNKKSIASFILNKKNIYSYPKFKSKYSSEYFGTINKLQEIPFEINSNVLTFILTNKNLLIDLKLLNDDGVYNMSLIEYKKKLNTFDVDCEIIKNQFYNLKVKIYAEYLILNLAIYFLDKILYFPKGIDYRGRIYSTTRFSPQGSSLNKSLLQFQRPVLLSNKKSIDDWLYYGGATCLACFNSKQDCINFINKNENIILLMLSVENINDLSIDNINKIKSLIHSIDNFYLFLAFCYEYRDYCLNGKKYVYTSILSSLDASQSAIQIFSAITKDKNYGKLTNMFSESILFDYYQYITNNIYSNIKKNLINNTKIDIFVLLNRNSNSDILSNRKTYKTLIMGIHTYGITKYSAYRYIEDSGAFLNKNEVLYIVDIVFFTLNTFCSNQKKLQLFIKFLVKKIPVSTTLMASDIIQKQTDPYAFRGKMLF